MTTEPDDLLPGNATEFERAQSKTSARLLETDTAVIRRARNPAQAPAAFLPFLAAERSAHRFAGGDAQKRAQVASSFDDHLAYGTPAALEAEIAADTGQDIRVIEHFEEPGLTFPDFIVDSLVSPGEQPPDLDAVAAAAIRRKNVRECLVAARVRYRPIVGQLYYGAAAYFSTKITMKPARAPNLFHGAAARMLPKLRISPL